MIELFYPWFLLFIMIACIMALYKRWWRISCLLFVMALGLNMIIECFALNFDGPSYDRSSSADGIKFMSFNIDGAEMSSDAVSKVADFVLDQDADVVLLVECFREGPGALHEILSREYTYGSPLRFGKEMRLYSRYPVSGIHRIESATGKQPSVFSYDLDVDGRTVRLYGCHLASNNLKEDHSYSTPDDIEDMKQLKGYFSQIRYASGQRKIEAASIADDYSGSGHPALVLGDFNDVSASPVMKVFENAGFRDAWWEGGFGYGATYRSLPYRIDHILYSREFQLVDVKLVRTSLSDHNALTATFMIDPADS